MRRRTIALAYSLLFILLSTSTAMAATSDLSLANTLFGVRLISNAACTASDGSVVLGGMDPYSSFDDSCSVAIMHCVDPSVDGNHVLWTYEANVEENAHSFISELQALPDNSICALLTIYAKDEKGSQKQRILRLKDGKVISEQEVAEGVSKFMALPNGLLLYAYHVSDQPSPKSTLSLYDHESRLVWECVFQDDVTVSRLLAAEDGYFLVGSKKRDNKVQVGYVAKLSFTGSMLWERQVPSEVDSAYRDAALTTEGDIVAVGGVYQDSYSSTFAQAIIACYSSEGETKWSDAQSYDELSFFWDSIAITNHGFVMVGTNNFESATVSVSHYDKNGHRIYSWNEPISTQIDRTVYLGLIATSDESVYLCATGDTGWWLKGDQVPHGDPRYLTNLHKLNYESPL